MLVPMIGTLYSSMRRMKLNVRWQQRKRNPGLPKGNEENAEMARLRREAQEVRRGNAISSIDAKLKSGLELSPEELSYLKEHCPELYAEAVEAKQERRAYQKELENCKTKEEAGRLHSNKMQSFLAAAKTIGANPNIPRGEKQKLLDQVLRRVMGIEGEQAKFIQTGKYARLPEEEEVKKGEKKEKEKGSLLEEETDFEKAGALFEELKTELSLPDREEPDQKSYLATGKADLRKKPRGPGREIAKA